MDETMVLARVPCSWTFWRLDLISSRISSSHLIILRQSIPCLYGLFNFFLHLFDHFDRNLREVIHKIQRILDLVGDAGCELTEGGELFLLDELGSWVAFKSSSDFCRGQIALFNGFSFLLQFLDGFFE
jgi:hypothetical protein